MQADSQSGHYRFTFVLVITLAVLAAFLYVIGSFLLDILLAAIFAGMIYPLFEKVLPYCHGRRGMAVTIVVVLSILAIVVPAIAIIALVGSEAVQLGQTTVEWVRRAAENPDLLKARLPSWLVQAQWLQDAISFLTAHAADIVAAVAGFLSRNASAVTQGALRFFLDAFVVAFAFSYFLGEGPNLVEHLINQIPVARSEAHAIVDRTLAITSASLKSIVIVGAVQGALVGLAFAVVGLGQPWFWGTVAAIASTIPAIGAGIVWLPGAIYLLINGQIMAGLELMLWGLLVVASVDNVLRIYIIGRSATIPAFLIFVSTLGGLIVFGPPGVLIGPALTGVVIGVLDLYQSVLKSSGLSNEVEPADSGSAQ